MTNSIQQSSLRNNCRIPSQDMESEDSLPYSAELATGHYSEPEESSPQPHKPFLLTSILILSSNINR
jgi:hypothetical protein